MTSLLALLALCFVLAAGIGPGGEVVAAVSPILGDSAAPSALLAQATSVLPDANSNAVAVWLLIGLLALIPLLGGVAGGVLALLSLWDRVRGKRNEVQIDGRVTTAPNDEAPSRVEFDVHVTGFKEFKEESRAVRGELLTKIEEVSEKLDRYSSDNYRRRRAMHREVNAQRTALAFMAGKLHAQGDVAGAEHIQQLIIVREEEGSDA